MILWLWDTRNRCGVSDNERRAREAAAEALISDDADVARLERVVTVLGIQALVSAYERTGERWWASHRDGRITWVRAS